MTYERGNKTMSIFGNVRRTFSSRYEDEYYDDDRDYEEEEYEEERPRKGFFSSLFSRSRDDEYEDYEEEEYEEEDSRSRFGRSRSSSEESRFSSNASKSSIRYNKPSSQTELVVLHPKSFDDSIEIVKELKEGKITVFDTSGIETPPEARRVVDYISGAAEGIGCPFERLCPSIFCIAPRNVKLTTNKSGVR